MPLFTATFVLKMHISHDFTAKKTCPSYELLVALGQVRGMGWPAGWVTAG